jgi:hypothetical protein
MLTNKLDIKYYKKYDAEMQQSSGVEAVELVLGAITVLPTVSVILSSSSSSPPQPPCVGICKQVRKYPQSITLLVHSCCYCP